MIHSSRTSLSAFRPRALDDFIGQESLKENLRVAVTAAQQRSEPMEHMLLSGPAGLGKTTLAGIIAHEMNVPIRHSIGPAIARAGDLAAIVTQLAQGEILFIDEIHRLHPSVEEMLYPAMEDYHLDVILGAGNKARTMRVNLKPFTLIGATTRAGLVSRPLRERFGLNLRVVFYDEDALTIMIEREARRIEVSLEDNVASAIAIRARGTPRTALRLLRRLRDFLDISEASSLNLKSAQKAFETLGIDQLGLDDMDRNYLTLMAHSYKGGPAGLETLAAALGEERDVIESVIEPFLIQQGMIHRTPRGRMLSPHGWKHLGLTPPDNASLFAPIGEEND